MSRSCCTNELHSYMYIAITTEYQYYKNSVNEVYFTPEIRIA